MSSPPIAGPPSGPVDVPPVVAAFAGGGAVTPVWRNGLGGLTFRVGDQYVKWSPATSPGPDLRVEADRLRWASPWARVPRVVGQGADEHGSWLVTEALPGWSPVDPRRPVTPEIAARAIGRGLRSLHDAAPVAGCPFDWGVPMRLAKADRRIAAGMSPAEWWPEHRGLDVERARAKLGSPPEIDRLVVCHGDACVPNTLIDDAGSFAGHVDLGSLGVADRWADLAVAAWSMDWNFGPGHDGLVYEAYGVAPDPVRIAYSRLLWDLT
ncbi:aminoglycoside 3'-phosphotransferase [Herbidospora daliensis]|uniref:aminoglycoside 3'-phosphotransferase n=1 Tax=Herbidospora daliensis TaxID=295585 RepID=UPI000782DBB8|nr:aminoglycoside 3'-phosphotransferase [Herbidospora daliensis]